MYTVQYLVYSTQHAPLLLLRSHPHLCQEVLFLTLEVEILEISSKAKETHGFNHYCNLTWGLLANDIYMFVKSL